MQVGLIGPYPPPRGGVSVHVKRLEDDLRDQGVEVIVFDANWPGESGGKLIRKLRHIIWLLQFLICAHSDVWHIHVSGWPDRAFIIFMARMRKIKTVVTFHSLRDEFDQMNFWQKLYSTYAVNYADHLIAAGDNEKDKLVKWFNCKGRLSILNAFIPPKQVPIEMPEQAAAFIRNHKFIISANASNMDFYQGYDIYGLDMLVELCGRLSSHMNVGFVYCLTRLTDKAYWGKIQARIRELKIEDSFLILLDDMEFWPILQKSHLFIRPTCTDSYGVSIAEALTMGVPSVASDVCQRPKGTILFQSRNSEDLDTKVCEIIRDYDVYSAGVQNLKIENCVPIVQRIYQELVGKQNDNHQNHC